MTGARLFVLAPTDTLFFRDGRPYNQDDDGLAHARSLFPPHPSTLTGALRAALALGRTHDPRVHERLRVRGLAADPEQAASWYRKAAAAGDAEAERNLQKLTDWLAGKGR